MRIKREEAGEFLLRDPAGVCDHNPDARLAFLILNGRDRDIDRVSLSWEHPPRLVDRLPSVLDDPGERGDLLAVAWSVQRSQGALLRFPCVEVAEGKVHERDCISKIEAPPMLNQGDR